MVSHSREWRSGGCLLSVEVGRWDVVVALGRRKLFGTADTVRHHELRKSESGPSASPRGSRHLSRCGVSVQEVN